MAFPATLADLRVRFPDEQACAAYLERLRWPRRFVCPWCESKAAPYRFRERPAVLRCRECMRDVRVTEGTAIEGSRLPLWTWIAAAFLALSGAGAAELQGTLELRRYGTAARMLRALRLRDPGAGGRERRFRAMLGPGR